VGAVGFVRSQVPKCEGSPPPDQDLSVGTPDLHPTDRDLSVGTAGLGHRPDFGGTRYGGMAHRGTIVSGLQSISYQLAKSPA
jgi:hypothetical protein